MPETLTIDAGAEPLHLLADWISREQLAIELFVTPDTLARWDARRDGPPCTRIGRKVFYRRSSVEQWLLSREQGRPAPQRRGRR